MATKVDNINDEKLLEYYMVGLKEDIKHHIFLAHPKNVIEVIKMPCHSQAKNKAIHRNRRLFSDS